MPGFFGRCPWTYSTKDCILRYACQCGCSSVDRVLASEAKGRWFDSSQPHQFGILPSCFPVVPVFPHLALPYNACPAVVLLVTPIPVQVLLCLIDHFLTASPCCSSIILKSIAHDYNLCVAFCMVSAKIPRLYCIAELMLSFDATVLTNLQGSSRHMLQQADGAAACR
jgi:hypothetical protein